MTNVSLDDVKKLAALAALAVSDDEAKNLTAELEEILKYVRQLDSVDTKGLEPSYQVTGLKNVVREDTLIDYQVSTKQLLANVPEQEANQIKVGRVI